MLAALADPLRDGLAARALLEVSLLGAACGPLGAWVLYLRRAYASEALAHALLPGLVVGALAGLPTAAGAAAGAASARPTVAARIREGRVIGGSGSFRGRVTCIALPTPALAPRWTFGRPRRPRTGVQRRVRRSAA